MCDLSLTRLIQTLTPDNGQTRHSYDALDHLASVTDPVGITTSYTTDGLDNLTQESSPDSGTAKHTWDAAGNLLTSTSPTGIKLTYTHDPLNRLTDIKRGATVQVAYTWDTPPGKLTGFTDLSGSTAYQYDPQGRLASKTQTQGTLVQTLAYGWQPGPLLAQMTLPSGNVLAYTYNQGKPASLTLNGAALISAITHDPDGQITGWSWPNGLTHARLLGLDGEFQFIQSALNTIHPDHLGTPRQITDSQNRIVWRWDTRDAFGSELPNEDPDGDGKLFTFNLRFPGQYFDRETGRHYNYFRNYDPATGRYTTSDPIGLAGGMNRFAYTLNNPIAHSDPSGLDIWICNRKVNIEGLPGVGNHAYLWNDKTKSCCGRNQGHDPLASCKEKGPDGDACTRIPSSSGFEGEVMRCCQKFGNRGPWLPPFNDCHTSAADCLSLFGLSNPGAPGGRMGQCGSCWQ